MKSKKCFSARTRTTRRVMVVAFFLLSITGSMNICRAADMQLPQTPANDFFDPFDTASAHTAVQKNSSPVLDPIEGYNQGIFRFNDRLHYFFFKPCAQGFTFILPEPARLCLKKFFHNLAFPVRFVSCLSQGKLIGSGIELSRFAINTTGGVAGFFDPAKRYCRLQPYEEDMGQTFGVYGMKPGFYFIIPFLGFSSGRDAMGEIFNLALDPATYLPGATVLRSINNLSLSPGQYEDMQKSAIAPYIAFREAYFQYRENMINK